MLGNTFIAQTGQKPPNNEVPPQVDILSFPFSSILVCIYIYVCPWLILLEDELVCFKQLELLYSCSVAFISIWAPFYGLL